MDDSKPDTSTSILWNDDGQPESRHFGDIYFSKEDGLAESRHVFVHHSRLPERFREQSPGGTFTIAETGFGTGLNFLLTLQLWLRQASEDSVLHYISVEKYPLSQAELYRAQRLWPELEAQAKLLIENYPQWPSKGIHRLNMANDRVRLTLIIDDAQQGLASLLQSTHPAYSKANFSVDAWFLDGFAPAKNPDMWSSELFLRIQQLSHQGTTLATFTAARAVKDGLRQHGFEFEKVPGYGKKRDMLRASLKREADCPALAEFPTNARNSAYPHNWHIGDSQPNAAENRDVTRDVTIVGGGIAGATMASAMASRGWKVTLLERNPALAQEGSGNKQGIVYARLSHRLETLSSFNAQALQFANRFYSKFWDDASGRFGQRCGVLQMAHNSKVRKLQQLLIEHLGSNQSLCVNLDSDQSSEIAGIPLQHNGVFFPAAGWVNPASVCEALTAPPEISVFYHSLVCGLSWEPQASQWNIQLKGEETLKTASHVILCNAIDVINLQQTAQLPLKSIAGQVTHVSAGPESTKLKTVLCGEGYIAPAEAGTHCIGATFRIKEQGLDIRTQDHHDNLNQLAEQVPSIAQEMHIDRALGGRTAYRCTTPDYLPMSGVAPQREKFLECFGLLRKNARANLPMPGPSWPNLSINVGFGSRGLTYAPLCAEILACQLNNEPSPVGSELQKALHPGRFWIRDLIRNKI